MSVPVVIVLRMGRPARIECANEYVQHLTWTTRGREDLLSVPQIAAVTLSAFEQERDRLKMDVYAYVLMPDHVHMIVGPTIMKTGTVVQWMKLTSTSWLLRDGFLARGPWSPGYWDRAMRNAAQLMRAIEYLHANPVRAGITDLPWQYQNSSCRFYENGDMSPLKITPAPLY